MINSAARWPSSWRLVIALLLTIAVLVVGRGGRKGRRSRRASRSAARTKYSKVVDDDEAASSWSRLSRIESAVAKCGKHTPLPPERVGGIAGAPPSVEFQPPSSDWRYLQMVSVDEKTEDNVRFKQAEFSTKRQESCRDLFTGRSIPGATGKDTLVCVLSPPSEDSGRSEEALFVINYNEERGIPNYVAFTLPGSSNRSLLLQESQEITLAASALDLRYEPSSPEPCCWCSDEASSLVAEGSGDDAFDCGEAADARGHLVPLSGLDASQRLAAHVFLNTVPTRRSFFERQWSQRLQQIFDHAHYFGANDGLSGRRLHVLVGPSLQTDGKLKASNSELRIDVPSFLWAAYADPHAMAATGLFCRNGLANDTCACVEGLKVVEMESRLGFKLFPSIGAEAPNLVNPTTRWSSPSRPSSLSSSLTFLWVIGGIILVLLLLVICVAVRESDEYGSTMDSKKNRIQKAATAQNKAALRDFRTKMENAAGGSDALRARFKKV